MNKQEFDNLKVGDKVVVARVVNPRSGRYQGLLNPTLYIDQEGIVEDVYSLGGGGIEVLFEDGLSWYFNIEDIDLITEKETVMQKTKTPHKHAAIIKAWADGEEVEVKTGDGQWRDLTTYPCWDGIAYRIKKNYEKRYRFVYESKYGVPDVLYAYYSEDAFKKEFPQISKFQKLEWTEKLFEV